MSKSCLMEDVEKERCLVSQRGEAMLQDRGSASFFYHTTLRKDIRGEGANRLYILSARKFILFSDILIKLSNVQTNFIGLFIRIFEKYFYRH
jgi:hypothetical protein